MMSFTNKMLFTTGWHDMPNFGCMTRMERGVLLTCPLLVNGGVDWEGESEVTAPEQGFLAEVNVLMGTDFKTGDFAGR